MSARWLLVAWLIACTGTSPAQDSTPRFTGFNGTGIGYAVGPLPERLAQLLVGLLNHDAVINELKLTPDQVSAFAQLKAASRTSLELDSTVKNAASDEEHDRAMAANRIRLNTAANEVQEKIKAALQPEQARRLTEISVQMRGFEALADAAVAKELRITDEQLAQLAFISNDIRTRIQANRKASKDDRAQLRIQMRRETINKITAILTADQKVSLEQMKGRKIDIKLTSLFDPR